MKDNYILLKCKDGIADVEMKLPTDITCVELVDQMKSFMYAMGFLHTNVREAFGEEDKKTK